MEAKSVAGAAIIHQLGPITGLAQGLAASIPADRFGRLCAGVSGPVQANHPAWVFGHLCLYPGRVATLLGVDAGEVLPPDGWEELFGPGAACVDDPEGSVYPGKDELLERYAALHDAVRGVIADVDDAKWAEETPVERYRGRFPTVLTAVAFLMGSHAMLHLGQVSTWRRVEGLASVM